MIFVDLFVMMNSSGLKVENSCNLISPRRRTTQPHCVRLLFIPTGSFDTVEIACDEVT